MRKLIAASPPTALTLSRKAQPAIAPDGLVTPTGTPKGWRLTDGDLSYEVESPHLDRGVIRAALSIHVHDDDGDALLYCDRVSLTSHRGSTYLSVIFGRPVPAFTEEPGPAPTPQRQHQSTRSSDGP